jgi:DNA mismatch endonuclease, patch repair protein
MDVHDKETRSYNMSKISARDTTIELIVRKYLHKNGFRYSIKNKKIPGNPDVTFPKYKIAIFLNGCFFHNHQGCALVKTIKTNEDFWKKKIQSNVARDINNTEQLKNQGWNVITLWECELEPRKKTSPKREFTLETLRTDILQIIKI